MTKTVEQVKIEFVVSMKRARTVIDGRTWCCQHHRAIAVLTLKTFSIIKNEVLASFKDLRIDDGEFVQCIETGINAINDFANIVETDDSPHELQINMPAPGGVV